MKETKIKTSSLSLTLKPGNKNFSPFNNFFIIGENKSSKKEMGGI